MTLAGSMTALSAMFAAPNYAEPHSSPPSHALVRGTVTLLAPGQRADPVNRHHHPHRSESRHAVKRAASSDPPVASPGL